MVRKKKLSGLNEAPMENGHIMRAGCKHKTLLTFIALYANLCATAWAQDGEYLTALSLEDLMNIEVTSVSKKDELASEAPAAIFVLTSEDIRRSGATTVPEALRMVPGLHVGQIDASRYSVSSRGFAGLFSDKLLVLIDGRTVYSPLFSGVFWDAQDVMLEDIERIEVIRGPGASVWGANAVNGVINILSKKSSDTLGGMVVSGGGNSDHNISEARYGVSLGESATARVYSKYRYRPDTPNLDGENMYNYWESGQGGFRFDYNDSVHESTLQGDINNGREGTRINAPTFEAPFVESDQRPSGYSGGNILARYEYTPDKENSSSIQFYYDRALRGDPAHDSRINTFDLDGQYRHKLDSTNEIQVGAGYRRIDDVLNGRTALAFAKEERGVDLLSAFVQEESRYFSDSFRVLVGTKFERNDYTGFEVQPNIRFTWLPVPHHVLWASFSQALRTPARADRDMIIDLFTVPPRSSTDLPVLVTGNGFSGCASENLLGYEVGHRYEASKDLNFESSLYINRYSRLNSFEPVAPYVDPSGGIVQPYLEKNLSHAVTYGGEEVITWQALESWRIQAWYSLFKEQLGFSPYSQDDIDSHVQDYPKHQAFLRSLLDLGHNVEFDSMLRFEDSISNPPVSSYMELDLRIGWKPIPSLDISLILKNLLHNKHEEYQAEFIQVEKAEIGRSIFGKVTWQF